MNRPVGRLAQDLPRIEARRATGRNDARDRGDKSLRRRRRRRNSRHRAGRRRTAPFPAGAGV